jgi:LPXTG-motif cell wall-anchored protein
VMTDNGVAGAGETNCPPGAAVQAGSLAYTGAGNDATMSLLGGALTAGGLVCLIMARKRRAGRQH